MIGRMIAWSTAAAAILVTVACGTSPGGTDKTDARVLVVGIDLPLQGVSKDASTSTIDAMRLYLDQIGGTVGGYTIELKDYDDSTAVRNGWDDSTCAKNAQEHVATENEVAVMGTYNSGCAKIQVPILNQAPDGALLMISHGNTSPGLTKVWDAGEPDQVLPVACSKLRSGDRDR